MIPFKSFGKIPRLSREIVITEKIDGTNASIYIPDPLQDIDTDGLPFLVGSRSRWIVPGDDNFGFARWAYEHIDALMQLGPGHHFGEWWGSGIQRGYGLTKGEKRFSLFNVSRWTRAELEDKGIPCYVVPTLYAGPFTLAAVQLALDSLEFMGSVAAPGFMNPEGVIVYHTAAQVMFKKTIKDDAKGKGE